MTEERARQGRDTAENRPEATQRRRQERPTSNQAVDPTHRRYGVPADFFDREKYSYYSAVDKGSRLYDLTVNDDYDFVTKDGKAATGSEGRAGEGALRYQSGTVDGAPQYTYLLRKPMKFAAEDREKKVAKIDADEKARLKRIPEDAPDQSYTPG